MTTERFILNGKYLVDPTMNMVRDLTQVDGIRLETRVMNLLCLLAEHANQLVRREMLIKTIWNDYGGADEALTQSVSHLRKVLQDTSKTIIETIPKKGYVLHASLAAAEINSVSLKATKRFKGLKNWFIYPVLVLFISCFACMYFLHQPGNSPLTSTAVPFQHVSQPAPENYSNTITTIAPDSTRYKLIVQGDRRPLFYINDRLLMPDEMESHLDLIQQMKTELRKRQKTPE